MRIELSGQEWDALCDRDLDFNESALPVCCGNVSAFRDVIITIRGSDSVVTDELSHKLKDTWKDLCGSHNPDEWDWTILLKLATQAGLQIPGKK